MTLTCTNMPTYMCRYEVYGNLNAHNIVTETAGINVINSDQSGNISKSMLVCGKSGISAERKVLRYKRVWTIFVRTDLAVWVG